MTDIYQYIELNGRASLLDLSRHFHIKESAITPMVEFWVKKGKISVIDSSQSDCTTGKKCTDCFECNNSAHLIYMVNNL